jgi:hypothetical protein
MPMETRPVPPVPSILVIGANGDACWTIVRPPRLTNSRATGHYRVSINAIVEVAY